MKFKKEYLILALLIVGLAIYLMMRQTDHDADIRQPAKLEASKLNRLVVTVKQRPPVELVKEDDRWTIGPQKYPADPTVVGNMTRAVADLTLSAVVSESGSYDRYNLTPKERIAVQAFSDGKQVRAMSVGKEAPTYQHTFVLVEGDPRVYHARGQMASVFDQTVENLRDKAVFAADKQNVAEITVAKGSQTLTLVRKKTSPEKTADQKAAPQEGAKKAPEVPPFRWEKAGGQTVDQAAVDRLLDDIARLNCDGYLENEDAARLSGPVWRITFKDGKNEYRLAVFAKQDEKDEKWPATATATPYPFYLNKWRVEGLEKSFKELIGVK